MNFTVHIEVTLKSGLHDPPSRVIEKSLDDRYASDGIEVTNLTLKKTYSYALYASSLKKATQFSQQWGKEIFSNPQVEDIQVTVVEAP